MALLIDFKAGDKLIINGAVVENAGSNSKILLHNIASVLREKELLLEKDAQTPATRTYFSLQNAYIFKDEREEFLSNFREQLDAYISACPSAKDIGDKINAAVEIENYYKALKETRHLVLHEMELLQSLEGAVRQWAEETESMNDGEEVAGEEHSPDAPEDTSE